MPGIGTVLRVSGRKAAVARFLAATSWKPLSVYWKGQPRYKTSKRLAVVNGFNVDVSSATGLDLAGQVRDAHKFLRGNAKEFRRLQRLGLSSVLDFGVEVTDTGGPAYFRFPAVLLRALAAYGVELEVSYYRALPA
jgi:hypothetical protein